MKRFAVVVVVVAGLASALPAQAATVYGNQRLLPTQPGLLFANSIAVDAADNLFIGDSYNSSLWRLAADGTQTRIAPPYPDSLATNSAVEDASGKLYVTGYARLTVVDPANGWTTNYRAFGFGEVPYGITTDNSGNLFVVDNFYSTVLEYNLASGQTTQLNFGPLNGPEGIARDSAGDLFVTDTFNNRVVERTAAGAVKTVPFQGLLYPRGIATDQAGDVFVADSGNGRVVEMTPDGTQSTLPFTNLNNWSGNLQGDVGGVDGIAVDPAGNVFALDRGPSRIWELSPVQPQAITFSSSPPAGAVVGGTYSVSATGGGSGNPVLFSIDSTSTPGACSVSGSTVSLSHVGTCVVDAAQAGGGGYGDAPVVSQSFTISPGSQAITFTSTAPSGSVFGGTYSVSATGGGSGNPVTFSIDSSSTAGACSLSGSTVSFTGTGTCVIDADQAGSADYGSAAEVQQSFTIAPAPQTVTFNSTPPSGAAVGDSYSVSASGGGSGSPVTFSIDSSSTAGACSISASTVSLDAVGTCIVDADQAGNADYSAAPQAQQSFTIAKGTPVVTWATPAAINFGTPVGSSQLDASASVAGTFVYSPPGGTILQPGTQTLSATFTPSDQADWNSVTATTQLTVTFTQPPITTSSSGSLNVGSGSAVGITGGSVSGPVSVGSGGALFVTSGSLTGPVTVGPGGVLVIDSSSVSGPLRASGDAEVVVCGGTISGPLTIAGSSGAIRIGATSGCAGNTITGKVSLTNNTGGVSFVGNNVTGPVTVTGNSGGFSYSGNTVSGKETVSGNS